MNKLDVYLHTKIEKILESKKKSINTKLLNALRFCDDEDMMIELKVLKGQIEIIDEIINEMNSKSKEELIEYSIQMEQKLNKR